jgi:HK97 family phage major capsid protein
LNADKSYTSFLEDVGLVERGVRDPMRHCHPADFFRYAYSGRQNPSECGIAAVVDDAFRSSGYSSHSPYSVFMPGAAILKYLDRRTLQPYQTTVAGSGAELVENTLRRDLFIDALRPRSVVLSLGAQSVGNLKGDQQIPRMATASTAFWVTTTGSAPVASGAITESEGTFDATPLIVAPAQIGSLGKISRQLLIQGGDLANSVIANDVANALATGIDVSAIAGTGSGGQPTGVVNTSGVNAASGAAFAYATSVAAVQSVAVANGIINRNALGWTATPAVAGLIAQRPKIAGQPFYIWAGNVDTGNVNGHPAISSSNVPAGTAIFGDWSQVIVLTWGNDAAVQIEFNPFSGNYAGGDVQYRAMIPCNIVVRHPPSFTVVSSVT